MGRPIGVLMGGWGEERDVSIKTGQGIAAALEAGGHPVTRILAGPGLDVALRTAQVGVALLALHGRMGEDGKVQGLLEVMGIPYTGSGVTASALAMNKPMAKKVFRYHNLPTPAGYTAGEGEARDPLARHGDLGFPCIAKPSSGGSTVGVTVVKGAEELGPAIAEARRYGGEALVERLHRGRELTVGILGDEVLGSCEIAYPGDTFDYAHKYQGGSRYSVPPRLLATRIANVEAMALAAYRALGCRGYGRVDVIASEEDNDVILEVNTLPGMTPTSLLPKIGKARGLTYQDLVERILALAAHEDVRVRPARARRVAAPSPRKATG